MSEQNRPPDPYSGGVPPEPGQPPPAPSPPGYGVPPGYPPPAPSHPAQGYPAQGYPQGYPVPPPGPAPRTSNDAVVALVLAVLSWLMCPLVLALVALPFAARGKREIEASNGWVTGDGLVTAAKVIAWINIALSLLFLALFVVLLIAGAVSSGR